MNTVNNVSVSPPRNRGLDRLRELRAASMPDPVAASPGCTSCAGPVADAQDLLCPACYHARRAPGRLLPFDPARRRRTEQRLAHRRCETCRGSWWRVLPNGDSECEQCRRSRTATTETRTDGVPGAAS